MKRLPNWERRLDAHFAAALRTPFAWGTFDCAQAVCQAVAAITGIDPSAGLAGEYATSEEASALLALASGVSVSLANPTQITRKSFSVENDLGTLAAAIAENLGLVEVRPSLAQRGDVVLVDNAPAGAAASRALGLVDLTGRWAWCAAAKGFIRMPMQRWLRAWHI